MHLIRLMKQGFWVLDKDCPLYPYHLSVEEHELFGNIGIKCLSGRKLNYLSINRLDSSNAVCEVNILGSFWALHWNPQLV